MKITNLNKVLNASGHISAICWDCGQQNVQKKYMGTITAELLSDEKCVLVVEPMVRDISNNAVVFNCDGSEKARLNSPLSKQGVASRFVGVYKHGETIKLLVTAFHESTRISIESEFDLNNQTLQLVNERRCK